MSKPNGILAMNPEKYREIDGVVFDEASYARHCQPKPKKHPLPRPHPKQVSRHSLPHQHLFSRWTLPGGLVSRR